MKKQKELLIIMPAYNEEKNIEAGFMSWKSRKFHPLRIFLL